MPYRAVLFDLLTALLDSWTLWSEVAGDAELARRWRKRYLDVTYGTGRYRPYEALVAEAAADTGLPADAAERLAAGYGGLAPWPGVTGTLRTLQDAGLRLGVVTNCSERLGQIAAGCVGVAFDAVVTAERVGVYKPEPAAYEAGIAALGVPKPEVLFVAGSAYDLVGTAQVGLDTFWHDRAGMIPPEGTPPPLARSETIEPLLDVLGIATRPRSG